MFAHKQHITIKDPSRLVLSNLPFLKGQRVEILLIAENEQPPVRDLTALTALFKETQSLPQVRTLTEKEIKAEVDLFRRGGK